MTHDELVLAAALTKVSKMNARYVSRLLDVDHGLTEYTRSLRDDQLDLVSAIAEAEALLSRAIGAATGRQAADASAPVIEGAIVESSQPKGRIGMTSVDVGLRDPQTYVSPEVWDRQVQLIMRDHAMDRELAERTFGQAIAYLVTAAENPDIPMGPASAVDKGVHSFVLDTPNYIAFCTQHAGGYLHHVPHLPGDESGHTQLLQQTIQAIRVTGFWLDAELWGAPDVDCTQCYNGCSDSPK